MEISAFELRLIHAAIKTQIVKFEQLQEHTGQVLILLEEYKALEVKWQSMLPPQ